MFVVFCASCGRRQLMSASRVRRLDNEAGRITVTYQCWCGALGSWVTGRYAGPGAARTTAVPAGVAPAT